MSFRNLLYVGLAIAAAFWSWDRAITQDGLVRYIDGHPETPLADRVLYTLGSFHELFNRNQRALEIYQRVVKNYPESTSAEPAQFGVASSLERLRRWREAIAEYEVYIEKYPKGRFAGSVSNNLQILKSR